MKAFFTTIRQGIRDINSRYRHDCANFHILFLVYTGYWPLLKTDRNRFLILVKAFPYVVLVAFLLADLLVLYDTVFKVNDHVLFAEGLLVLICLIKITLAAGIAIFKIEDIVGLFIKADKLFAYVVGTKEKQIYDCCQKKALTYSLVLFVTFSILGLLVFIEPLFEATRRYPTHFDLTLETPYYEVIFLGAFLMGVGSWMMEAVIGALIVSGFMYLNGYLEVLQFRLEHGKEIVTKNLMEMTHGNIASDLRMTSGFKNQTSDQLPGNIENNQSGTYLKLESTTKESFESDLYADIINLDLKDKEEIVTDSNPMQEHDMTKIPKISHSLNVRRIHIGMEDNLIECIEFHIAIFRAIRDVQQKANPILCIEVLSSAIVICIAMFIAFTVPFGIVMMILWVGILAAILQNIYGICYITSELNALGMNVSDALYFSDWTEASPSYKRSMLIMMSRARKPIEISTMSFLVFNMEMFRNVLNSAYSHFNMLRSMSGSN